jgi:hypothetical protein
MFNILNYKRNENLKNNTETPSHPSQNGNHQENKQQQILAKMRGEKEPLYTIGGNLN